MLKKILLVKILPIIAVIVNSLSQGSASALAGEVAAVSDEPEAPSPAINRNEFARI